MDKCPKCGNETTKLLVEVRPAIIHAQTLLLLRLQDDELPPPEYQQYADLVDRIDALLATGGWMPIETAPKDGTRITVLYASGDVEDNVYWADTRYCMLGVPQGSSGPGWVSTEAGNLPVDDITHWQPLPSLPKENT